MAVILFINLKGGVGKTTNAVAIAECLASSGKPTLMIDADQQCTASELLLDKWAVSDADRRKRTFYDLIVQMFRPDFEKTQFDGYVARNASNINGGLEHLSVIPCSPRIDDLQTNYAKAGHGFKTRPEFRRLFDRNGGKFSQWLKTHFAFTLIDCPPSLALQVLLLLRVSDTYVIPCQPNYLSIRGAISLREQIQKHGYKRRSLGILWSMCRGNDRKHNEIISERPRQNGHAPTGLPFDTTIPLAASIARAFEPDAIRPTSFRAKYGSEFAKIYETLVKEMIRRLKDGRFHTDNGNGEVPFE
jgi:chromosome partitioning protein